MTYKNCGNCKYSYGAIPYHEKLTYCLRFPLQKIKTIISMEKEFSKDV